MMILLGQVQDVDPKFLHQAVMLLIGALGGAASVAAVLGVVMKRRTQIEPQPLIVTVPEINRRLDGHDVEITNLWNTMRKEDKEIRDTMAKSMKEIERSLGYIEGQLKKLE